MSAINRILVVVHRGADASHVLQKAAMIAQANPDGARVQVVRVVFEEFVEQTHLDTEAAHSLKLYLMQAEEEFLVDLVNDYRSDFADVETATLWDKRVSDAVPTLLANFAPDLIIKSADPESPHFPRHPDDWNLLRRATCPVLLVKPERWAKPPSILAAIDVIEPAHQKMNGRILQTAAQFAQALGGHLHIANALPRPSRHVMSAELGIDFGALLRDQQHLAQQRISDLQQSLDLKTSSVHVQEGIATHVLAQVADSVNAAVVVAGTSGRNGVAGVLIGNTSEALLHNLHQDLLVLHN